MRKWIITSLLLAFVLVGYATINTLRSVPEPENPPATFQLTATRLILMYTETASAASTSHALGTPDPFELTATELIRTATEGVSYQLTTTQHDSSLLPPTGTPDEFQLIATQLIADATQTAVSLQDSGCITVERRVWDINEVITDSKAQTVEVYADSYVIDGWVCNGELVQSRPAGDYRISPVTFEETITAEVAAELVERAIELIMAYPPDDAMMPPITVQVNAFPPIVVFDSDNPFFALDAAFTYEEAMTAYESGLRGQALLDALGIVVPE